MVFQGPKALSHASWSGRLQLCFKLRLQCIYFNMPCYIWEICKLVFYSSMCWGNIQWCWNSWKLTIRSWSNMFAQMCSLNIIFLKKFITITFQWIYIHYAERYSLGRGMFCKQLSDTIEPRPFLIWPWCVSPRHLHTTLLQSIRSYSNYRPISVCRHPSAHESLSIKLRSRDRSHCEPVLQNKVRLH